MPSPSHVIKISHYELNHFGSLDFLISKTKTKARPRKAFKNEEWAEGCRVCHPLNNLQPGDEPEGVFPAAMGQVGAGRSLHGMHLDFEKRPSTTTRPVTDLYSSCEILAERYSIMSAVPTEVILLVPRPIDVQRA